MTSIARLRLVIVGCLALVALVSAGGRVALAHAQLDRADPPPDTVLDTSPPRLQLWFTEPLEPGFSQVQALDASGARVDRGDSAVVPGDPPSMRVSLPPLDRGVYTVTWQTLSKVDGHIARGSYSLLIGVEAPTTSAPVVDTSAVLPWDAVSRWLGYLGTAALLGAALCWQMVLIPLARRLRLSTTLLPPMQPRLRRLLWAGWAVLAIATLLALIAQTADTGGGPGAVGQLLFGTRYGTLWLMRAVLVAALAATLWLTRRRPGQSALILLLASGVILVNSLNSHSAALGALAGPAVAMDWLHFMGVAVWVGGLFVLTLVLPAGLAALPSPQRWAFLARLIPRFSGLAVAALAALVTAGVYLAWLHVGSLDALGQTVYGKSLLVKLALFAPLLLLGAVNLLVLSPRLAAAVAPDGGRVSILGHRFSVMVRGEAMLAALVLLAAGVLTSVPPARQTYERLVATRPLEMTLPAGDLSLTLTITPARPGVNTFTMRVLDGQRRPVDNAERVDMRFTYLSRDMGTTVQVAQPQGDGRYSVRGGFVGVEGRWQVESLVRRAGRDDERTAFRFVVTPTSAAPETSQPTLVTMLTAPLALLTAGLVALLVLLGLAVYVRRTSGLRSPAGAATALLLVALVATAGVVVLRPPPTDVQASGSAGAAPSQVASTQASLARGEAIYRDECQICHGSRGRGDGPLAASLNPRPADFRVHMAAGHTDSDLFAWVSDGVLGTSMPPFKASLSVEDRWHVINFIRTFAPVAQ